MATPAVSRWPSVRLPIVATFPQAPLRSRTVGFPQSGSDLGFPLQVFPARSAIQALTHLHLAHAGLPTNSSPLRGSVCSRLCVRETTLGPPSAQSPFAPCRRYRHGGGVARLLERRYSFVIAHTDSCARPLPSSRLWHRLVRKVFAGCCQPLLRNGPSRRYLCRSIRTCLDPYSGGPQGAIPRFLPRDVGLPRV